MEKEMISQLVSLRRQLHQSPELSGKESETGKRILSFLDPHPDQVTRVGNTGLLIRYGGDLEGPQVLVRAELDALPIRETNEFEHRSSREGVSHKCGHDGHMAILCGLGLRLKKQPPERGEVYLLFQPAEENGEGARAVLSDEAFNIRPDKVLALHNLPGYTLGEVVIRAGVFTAVVKSIIIRLAGKTSHAAEPEFGINPAAAVADLIRMFEGMSNPDPEVKEFALATPVYIRMGEKAYGVSAGEAEVHYTLRCWSNQIMEQMIGTAECDVKAIAEQYGLQVEFDWTQEFSANQNDKELTQMVKQVAEEEGVGTKVRETPFKWGEDFGLFTEKFAGVMFGLGAGEDHAALHNPDYDFPDDLIPVGVDLFDAIIKRLMK